MNTLLFTCLYFCVCVCVVHVLCCCQICFCQLFESILSTFAQYVHRTVGICYRLWIHATDCGYMLQTVGTCYRLSVYTTDWVYATDCGYMLQTVAVCYRLSVYATDCRYMLQTLGYAVDRVGVLQTLLRVCYRFQELLCSVL